MSDQPFLKLADMPSERSFYLTANAGEVILSTIGKRIFVRGEETSDVERIGAAFRDWIVSQASETGSKAQP